MNLLTILAVIIAVVGVIQLIQGQIVFALVLFVLAAIVGPKGYTVFRNRRTAT